MTVLFHDAMERARAFLDSEPTLAARRLLVRDLRGRIRIFLADREDPAKGLTQPTRGRVAQLAPALHASLGAYSPGQESLLLDAGVLADFKQVWDAPDAVRLDDHSRLLERTLFGEDWLRGPLDNRPPRPPRAVLYGLKGGVGRSTALAVLARHLAAERGVRALVVDLDLEAPGVGPTLLDERAVPDFGVVDWIVEDAVGQADAILPAVVGSSPLDVGAAGEVFVVPAAGRRTGAYLPKLSRAYQGGDGPEGPTGFGARIARLVDDLEARLRPDVVLLDSRSGLHDVAAVTLTRLGAVGLLFAIDSRQTWAGYRLLFEHWRDHEATHRDTLEDVRQRLFMVAGQIPETEQQAYRERFRHQAWQLFNDTLYDEPETAEDVDAFSFALEEDGAPHQPIPVYWNRVFQEYDPVRAPDAITPEQVRFAFGSFTERASQILLEPE